MDIRVDTPLPIPAWGEEAATCPVLVLVERPERPQLRGASYPPIQAPLAWPTGIREVLVSEVTPADTPPWASALGLELGAKLLLRQASPSPLSPLPESTRL